MHFPILVGLFFRYASPQTRPGAADRFPKSNRICCPRWGSGEAAFLSSDNEFPPWAMWLGLAVAVAIIYFLAARLSLALISRPDGVAVFWPAAGVASGVLIGLGPAARFRDHRHRSGNHRRQLARRPQFLESAPFAACNAGEAVIVAALIQRFFGSPFRLESLRRVFGLVAAAIVATALSGAVATVGYKVPTPRPRRC